MLSNFFTLYGWLGEDDSVGLEKFYSEGLIVLIDKLI